ncbi:TetR/AcrR family transcriptional regulator [Corynebacterium sp. USCH3]|uniref:TetR/AcrR family transcriptional regulator n=1 Tax=Corynebacterium sp. USCH3 TaxID=3024840 RepID=UPI0030B4CE08
MPYQQTEKTRAHAQGRRDSILRAATALISSGGFAAASVRAIADESGNAAGSVYRYFDNREKLLASVFRSIADREFRAVEDATMSARPTVADRLSSLLTTFSIRALRNPTMAEALLFEPVNPLVESERLTFRRRYHDLVVTVIRDGILAGEIPDQDAELSARSVIGANAEALMGRLSPESSVTDPDYLIASVTTFCLRALGAPQP